MEANSALHSPNPTGFFNSANDLSPIESPSLHQSPSPKTHAKPRLSLFAERD